MERTKCFIDQYSNYSLKVGKELLHVHGLHTLGENIADNGGVRQAYRAYQQYERDHGPEPVLPSLGYSQRQLFWLSFASLWCSVYRPEVLKLRLDNDYYSPEVFRVNGPVSNMVEFARDWNCPAGSAMAPVKRCSVWR